MTEKKEEEQVLNPFQEHDDSTDFTKEPLYTREQIDQILLESQSDSGVGLEYVLDSQGKTVVKKKRLPLPNMFVTDVSTAHLSIEDKVKANDFMELANDLIYDSKMLSKFGERKKVLVNLYKVLPKTQVFLFKGEKDGKPILEERIVEEELPLMVERDVPEDFFNLNPAITYFLNKMIALAHISKGVDGNAARLSHHQSISETASRYNYALDKEEAMQEVVEEKQKGNPFAGIQDWATAKSRQSRPFG